MSDTAEAVHELRNPLTTVQGLLETLLARGDDLDPDTARHLLAVALRNAHLLEHRLTTMLEFERLHSDAVAVTPKPLTLVSVLPRLVEDAGGLVGAHRVELDVPHDLVVWADEHALSHVVTNLLGNAAKHSPDDTTIQVRVRHDHEMATVEVIDHGTGIDGADLPHLFRPFYRGQDSTVAGAGIGLAVVQRYVQLSGGEVSIASRHGEGTRVSFTLPLTRPVDLADRPAFAS